MQTHNVIIFMINKWQSLRIHISHVYKSIRWNGEHFRHQFTVLSMKYSLDSSSHVCLILPHQFPCLNHVRAIKLIADCKNSILSYQSYGREIIVIYSNFKYKSTSLWCLNCFRGHTWRNAQHCKSFLIEIFVILESILCMI